jgi:hypothetical protein
VELEENVARERTRASWWAVATTVLFTVSGAGAQTPPLDREVKATPGREVRVGIYTSMRADCTNDDRFELEVSFADGRKQIQRFRVIISNGANEGQRT